MPRDKIIRQIFEAADDGMQSVIGYFEYVAACQHISNPNIIIDYLPQIIDRDSRKITPMLRITHEWGRFYSPKNLIDTMGDIFIFYHTRTVILSLIYIFEGCLLPFAERLLKKGMIKSKPRYNYKNLLKWAFKKILSSNYGSSEMRDRLPDICLDIDHARRIRNLCVHNNGLFNEQYATDGIIVKDRSPIIDQEYETYINNTKKKISFEFKPDLFMHLSCSHIEALHHLHSVIQSQYFGQKREYSYTAARKPLEWKRLLGV